VSGSLKEDAGGVSERADTREQVEQIAKEEQWGRLSELVLIFSRS